MSRPLPPTQRDVETAQRDLFLNGDMKAVAAHLDVDRSYVSRLLSPDDPEHRSPFYALLRWIYACDMQREELGDGHIVLLSRFRSRWLPQQENAGQVPPEVSSSMFSFLQAAIEQLPYAVQMKYLDEAYLTLDKFKRGLQMDGIENSGLDDKVKDIKARR